MFLLFSALFVILVNKCNSVIYYLNDTGYNRLPPIYHVDDYTGCLQDSNDVYCTVNFNLVSDEPSELLHLIQEYSEATAKHFNYTKLRYGVCVTQYCQPYIQKGIPVIPDLLERCLNNTIWNDCKLKTKVESHYCHTLSDHNIEVDTSDILVAVVLFMILLLNAVGTVYDTKYLPTGQEYGGILSCFSIRKNWQTLVKNTGQSDNRIQRLQGLHFLRCLILLGVMMVHCTWPYLIALDNPHHIELNFYDLSQHIFINGSIALQTYLVIAGFLMSFKMELHSEKKQVTWRMVPGVILVRYLRLTPVYAVTIAVMATWAKFVGPGPFWEVSAGLVRSQCRSRWWQNLLYINNYFYNSQCIATAWYLGVDMQMFVLGLITCVSLRSKARRAVTLTMLFILSITVHAVHIYVRDLNPILIMGPDASRTLFESDPSFNETYKMGHANITSYVVGLALGYLVYKIQQLDIDIAKYRNYIYLYWALLPLLLAVVLSGSVFYRDAPRDPMYIRVLYGALVKPTFGILVAGLICGTVLKLENVYRRVFECKVWIIPSRLSYCVYIIHLPYLRLYVSLQTSLLTQTTLHQLTMLLCVTVVSFATALPLWLLVEAPFVALAKRLSRKSVKPTEKPNTTNGCQKIDYNTYL